MTDYGGGCIWRGKNDRGVYVSEVMTIVWVFVPSWLGGAPLAALGTAKSKLHSTLYVYVLIHKLLFARNVPV